MPEQHKNNEIQRKCPNCKKIKLYSDFSKDKNTKTGVYSYCKECAKRLSKKYYENHKAQWYEWSKKYRAENPEKVKRWALNRYYRIREHELQQAKLRNEKLKTEVFNHYGNRCACCEETIKKFLTIDHINNDGAIHRKNINGRNVYRWLKKNGYPAGFQILCYNCNLGKARNNGVCPHAS